MGGVKSTRAAHERISYFFRICLDILSKLRTPESTLLGRVSQPKDFPGSEVLAKGSAENGTCRTLPGSGVF